MWGVAALLLISFTLIVFSRIARTRRMGGVFLFLGLSVFSVVAFHAIDTLKNEDALFAIMTFPLLSGAIADLIVIPILRRRVAPPCVRVKRASPNGNIVIIISSLLFIAFAVSVLVSGGLSSWRIVLGLSAVSIIIYLPLWLFERIEICGNGVWQSGKFSTWEEYESFSWKWEKEDRVELRLVLKSWIWPTRLVVPREDREAVHQLLEGNIADVTK